MENAPAVYESTADAGRVLGLVQGEPHAERTDPIGDDDEFGVAGERFPLRTLARPPYDPDGTRLRS